MGIASLLLLALHGAGFTFEDAFTLPDAAGPGPEWRVESIAWEIRDGQLAHVREKGRRTFTVLDKAPHGRRVVTETTLTMGERIGDSWALAGVAIRQDARDYWHLALVEAPSGNDLGHFVELQESLEGAWLATSAEGSRLTCLADIGRDFDWQYGRPYRLRIAMTPDRIDGWVSEMDGTERVHIAFAFDNKAVTSGQPALDCGDCTASFDDVRATVDDPVPPPEADRRAIPPYAVSAHGEVISDPTGFFHTGQIDGRWWLIDPTGQAFYMIGTDHARYTGHWCESLGYAPYGKNMAAKYGSAEAWAEATAERLAQWGFNTLPAGHSPELRYRSFAHIEFLSMGAGFAGMDDIVPKVHWTGVPNVFSPLWPRYCDFVAREQCAPNADDPWLIGYFIDNELEWYGKDHTTAGMFTEAWKKPADHTAKQAWIAFLKDALGTPEAFATAFGVEVDSWDALAAHTTPAQARTERAMALEQDWVRLVAERYFATTAEAIRRHDPNHLVLGSRFAGNAPDIWDIAGRHCDIVSYNIYPWIDVEQGVPDSVTETIVGWAESCGKPMMVTEWSFPALDSGLPCKHGAGMRVDTQAQRTKCFTHFQTLMFELPFMVGSNFFMFVDEPALGIASTFPEDSNYGLVNEQDEPYLELTAAATALHPRVYDLHATGSVPEPEASSPKLAKWLTEVPEPDPFFEGKTFASSGGGLRFLGPVDGRGWRLFLGGTLLGDWCALMNQVTAQPLWVKPDTARVTGVGDSDRVTVIEVELSREQGGSAMTQVREDTGKPAQQQARPQRFKSLWRFMVPGEDPGHLGKPRWFASQCLWVENTDTGPWRLDHVFHYIIPSLGGDSAGDEPVGKDVPLYYIRSAAWVDQAAGVGIGCWYPDKAAFQCRYWKDEGGGFHGDLRERVDTVLQPGQRHTMPGAWVFFFPLSDPTPEGFSRQSARIASEICE
jgi:hypothetical protein